MNTLPCAATRDLLPLYAEDMLSEETKNMVATHLAACESCTDAFCALTNVLPTLPAAKDEAKPLRDIRRRLWLYIALAALFGGLLWGLLLSPGDEMGYSVLVFYILMPLCALLCTAAAAAGTDKLRFLLPPLFTAAGFLLPFAVFHTLDSIGVFFGLLPSAVGFLIGMLLKRRRRK